MTDTTATEPKRRLVGIDVCRSFAIVAAMFSHATVAAGVAGHPTLLFAAVRLTMQTATPIFIGLFGAMLMVAYAGRFNSGRVREGVQHLLSRALQCYLLYAACVMVRLVIGDFSPGYALRCLMLLGVTQFTDILKFYAIMLVLAPLFIVWATRRKYGLWEMVGLAVLIQAAYPLLAASPEPPRLFGGDYLSFPAGFIYGGGEGPAGPSLMHGLTFIFVGMLIGRTAPRLLDDDPVVARGARRAMAGIAGTAFLATVALWDWGNPLASVVGLADMSLRNANHPLYFAQGVLALTVSTWVCLILYDRRGLKVGRFATFMGATSLFTFSFGNMLLIAAPNLALSQKGALAYSLALLAGVVALSWAFSQALKRGAEARREGRAGPAASFARIQNGLVARVTGLVTGPAKVYAERL